MQVNFNQFEPHPIIKGGHLQTILARVLGTPPDMAGFERLAIAFDDGDRTYARINHPVQSRPDTPVLALFHGLGGCSESPYKLRIAARGVAAGLRVARFSHRGCGPGPELEAQGIYHSGSREDVFVGLKALAARFPEAPIAVVGFSLSGAMVLNLLGHMPDIQEKIPQLRIASAVCSPIDLVACSNRLRRFQNLIYDQYFSYFLLKHVKRRAEQFNLPAPEFSKKMITLAVFDDEFTAPIAGYRDAPHYYSECSPRQVLPSIKVPTLILGAQDDPIVNPDDYQLVRHNSNLHLSFQRSGGHMGFLSGKKTAFGDRRWLDSALVTWALDNLTP